MTLLANGNVLYHSAANFNGEDSFTYTVKDASGAVFKTATVAFYRRSGQRRASCRRLERVELSYPVGVRFSRPSTCRTPPIRSSPASTTSATSSANKDCCRANTAVGQYDGATFSSIAVPATNNNQHPNSINNAGLITGYDEPGSSTPRYGFIDHNGSFTTVDLTPNVSTTVDGINESGVVVGSSYLHDGNTYSGYVYDPSSQTVTYLNAFGSSDTHANGINNYGDVVGTYGSHGFLYTGSQFITIDDPDGTSTTAAGINDFGQIVGWYITGTGETHGFLYSGGVFETIDDPLGTNGTLIQDINNAGEIAGRYITSGSVQHGFTASVEALHGTLSFSDPETTDTHTVSFVPENSGTGYVGTLALDPVSETNGSGTVEWHFSLDGNQALASHQTLTQSYDVTVADNHGASAMQSISVSIGGPGGDSFVFDSSTHLGADTIMNFNKAADIIDLDNYASITDHASLLAALSSTGADSTHGDAIH